MRIGLKAEISMAGGRYTESLGHLSGIWGTASVFLAYQKRKEGTAGTCGSPKRTHKKRTKEKQNPSKNEQIMVKMAMGTVIRKWPFVWARQHSENNVYIPGAKSWMYHECSGRCIDSL